MFLELKSVFKNDIFSDNWSIKASPDKIVFEDGHIEFFVGDKKASFLFNKKDTVIKIFKDGDNK